MKRLIGAIILFFIITQVILGGIASCTQHIFNEFTTFSGFSFLRIKEIADNQNNSSELLFNLILLILIFFNQYYSHTIIRWFDNWLLKLRKQANIFDGFMYKVRPLFLSKIVHSFFYVILGNNAFNTFLTWPLKLTAIPGILLFTGLKLFYKTFPESFYDLYSQFPQENLYACIWFIAALVLFFSIIVAVSIESYRKVKELFLIRVLFLILMGLLEMIFIIAYTPLIIIATIIVLLIKRLRIKLEEQITSFQDKSTFDTNYIIEPWEDGAKKTYTTQWKTD